MEKSNADRARTSREAATSRFAHSRQARRCATPQPSATGSIIIPGGVLFICAGGMVETIAAPLACGACERIGRGSGETNPGPVRIRTSLPAFHGKVCSQRDDCRICPDEGCSLTAWTRVLEMRAQRHAIKASCRKAFVRLALSGSVPVVRKGAGMLNLRQIGRGCEPWALIFGLRNDPQGHPPGLQGGPREAS